MGPSANNLGKNGRSRNQLAVRMAALKSKAEKMPLCAFDAGDLPLLLELFSRTSRLFTQEEIERLEARIADFDMAGDL